MHWFMKAVGLIFLICLALNGVVMAFAPHHLHIIPSVLRMYGIFNTSYGPRGGANHLPLPAWQVRLKGAIYLLGVSLVLAAALNH